MKAKHVRKEDNQKPERNGLFAGFGARIVRSLFFWGLAAVLASSAYTGIVKIRGNHARPADDEAALEVWRPGSSDDAAGVEPTRGDVRVEQTQGEVARMENAGEEPTQGENAGAEPTQGESAQTEQRRRVALTFDDGPHPVYTEELLDGLKERDVKATFFVIGENIPGNEDIIRRMDEEGHLIGNHTYNHVKISDMSKEDACEQIEKTSALIRNLTGKDTEFVRPPFGEWNKDLECSFVMIPVFWDVDPKDWTTKNVSDVVRRVLENTENGDIILLHDCYRSSVQAALEIVDELQGRGYEFVTVDELILE